MKEEEGKGGKGRKGEGGSSRGTYTSASIFFLYKVGVAINF